MGLAINLTGQKFGMWTVLHRSEKKTANRQAYWTCRCECGNIKDVCSSNLRNGLSTNCGCIRNKKISERTKKDLTNQRFGRLIAIEPTKERINSNIVWKCKCDCGKYTYVQANSLLSENTKSCGCIHSEMMRDKHFKDIKGKIFGHLTVLDFVGKDKHGKSLWKCQCDCINKNIIIVPTSSLTTGNTMSCGCINSKGEIKINFLLKEKGIHFETQKTFDTCRFFDTNALAKFDFYVDDKYIIEFDGEQHFKARGSGWSTEENLIKTREHDKFKNQWCKDNNIPLIRIPYTHLKDLCIEDLLLETSKFIIKE